MLLAPENRHSPGSNIQQHQIIGKITHRPFPANTIMLRGRSPQVEGHLHPAWSFANLKGGMITPLSRPFVHLSITAC